MDQLSARDQPNKDQVTRCLGSLQILAHLESEFILWEPILGLKKLLCGRKI